MSGRGEGRPRAAAGGRLLRLAAAAAGLGLAGFAAGAVLGLLWEAPGLVAAHWLGRSEEVPLVASGGRSPASDGASGAGSSVSQGEEDPAAELPAVAAGERPEGAEAAAGDGAPAAREGPDAPPRERGGFAVQVGAFAEEPAARELAGRLRAAGFPAYVRRGGEGAARHRVRVGPLASRAEAERTAGRLQRERDLPTWVLARERE